MIILTVWKTIFKNFVFKYYYLVFVLLNYSMFVIVSDDKVVNVRYSLCSIIPSLVNIFKVSTEKSLVDKLFSTINKLILDEDRTVQEQRQLLERCNSSIGQILQVI